MSFMAKCARMRADFCSEISALSFRGEGRETDLKMDHDFYSQGPKNKHLDKCPSHFPQAGTRINFQITNLLPKQQKHCLLTPSIFVWCCSGVQYKLVPSLKKNPRTFRYKFDDNKNINIAENHSPNGVPEIMNSRATFDIVLISCYLFYMYVKPNLTHRTSTLKVASTLTSFKAVCRQCCKHKIPKNEIKCITSSTYRIKSIFRLYVFILMRNCASRLIWVTAKISLSRFN